MILKMACIGSQSGWGCCPLTISKTMPPNDQISDMNDDDVVDENEGEIGKWVEKSGEELEEEDDAEFEAAVALCCLEYSGSTISGGIQ